MILAYDEILFHGKHLLVPEHSWRFQHQGTCLVPEFSYSRTPLASHGRLAAPDHTVPYGTVLSRTLSQALRARLRSVRPSGTKSKPASKCPNSRAFPAGKTDAKHIQVPAYRCRKALSRRDGRSHGQSHRYNEYGESKRGWGWPIIFGISKLKDVFSTFLPLVSSLSRDRFNRPAGTGPFS